MMEVVDIYKVSNKYDPTHTTSLRNAFAFFGVSAFEIIPFLNALPGWTLAVGLTIFFTRQEDAAYNKRIAPAQA